MIFFLMLMRVSPSSIMSILCSFANAVSSGILFSIPLQFQDMIFKSFIMRVDGDGV